MSVIYSDLLKKARMDLVDDYANAGASFGKLVIGTSGLSGATGVLATIILQDPAFGAAAGTGTITLTLAGVPLENNASAGGTAAKAEIRDSNDLTVVSGLTVGVSASDIIITSVTVVSGQPVRVTSGVLTHG